MSQTTAVEFQRKFGEFQHQAQREPVEITRHGRRELVLMSADHYDWLIAAAGVLTGQRTRARSWRTPCGARKWIRSKRRSTIF